MKQALVLTFAWLIVVNIFALVGHNRFNLNPDTAYTWIQPGEFPTDQSWDMVSMRERWDAYWYLDIVQHGYYLKTDNTLANVVFFPLYPTLIFLFGIVLFGHFALAGWVVSILSLFLAIRVFYRLVEQFHPDIDPLWPILLLLSFPTAFFFNVIYTEALFLFLTLGVFYHALRGEYGRAGAYALAGALTHSNGLFLALPILWEMWRTRGWRSLLSWRAWPILTAPLGTTLFVLYDAIRFGDPMLFFKIQSSWGRAFSINWEHFSTFSHPSIVNMGMDICFAIFIIGMTVWVYRTLSPLYAIFMSLTIVAALSSGTLMSIGRYSLVMFPVFIALARIRQPLFRPIWLFASTLFLALDILLFINNYWAG
jgi:hypothetical protein